MCNTTSQCHGGNVDALSMYAMVLYNLGYPMENIRPMELLSIYHNCQQIMDKYPPVLYDNNTMTTLLKLKDSGAEMSILSNTGFTKGEAMKRHLTRLGIAHLFDFMIFSDEVGLSKPNDILFKMVIMKSSSDKREILHVGDNSLADDSKRIDCLIINGDTNKNITHLLNL